MIYSHFVERKEGVSNESYALLLLINPIWIVMKKQVKEIKISYGNSPALLRHPKIKPSSSAAEILYEHWERATIGLRESFNIVLLDNKI